MSVTTTTHDDRVVLSIRGRFDFSAHAEFRKNTEEALTRTKIKSIEVNLREVDYLDSSALGMLLLLREKAQNAGNLDVSLSGTRGLVRQVLDVANFGRLFRID